MNRSPSNSNQWFVCPRIKPDEETRLFLFPYAGGGPASFSKWSAELPDNIEIWIAHYPGRGSRHAEPPITSLTELVDGLIQAIQPLLDKPFAFFGHSLGGLIAFELTRRLRQRNLPQPGILFVSACGSPHIPDPHPPIHRSPEPEFLKSLQQLNGIPSELLHQPDVMELVLPILRADFQAMENYEYISDAPLDCYISAFAGLNDRRLSQEGLEGWALHTRAGFKTQYFPGDHFFINTARESVIASVIRELEISHARN